MKKHVSSRSGADRPPALPPKRSALLMRHHPPPPSPSSLSHHYGVPTMIHPQMDMREGERGIQRRTASGDGRSSSNVNRHRRGGSGERQLAMDAYVNPAGVTSSERYLPLSRLSPHYLDGMMMTMAPPSSSPSLASFRTEATRDRNSPARTSPRYDIA